MKHTALALVKFKKLQRRLGFAKRRDAVGMLESLWLLTQRESPCGDIGKLDNETIAIELEWDGDPDELVDAFVATGWVDKDDEHRLVIHHWHHHAPRYIHGIVSKTQRGFVTVNDCSDGLQSPTTVDDYSTLQPNLTKPNLTKPKEIPSESCTEHASLSSVPPAAADDPLEKPEDGSGDSQRSVGTAPTECVLEPPVLIFPVVGKGPTEWPLTAAKLAEYKDSFPDLDVLGELRAARSWCINTPRKRKTPSGMLAFLTRWLTKAQNQGRGGGNARVGGPPPSKVDARNQRNAAILDEMARKEAARQQRQPERSQLEFDP